MKKDSFKNVIGGTLFLEEDFAVYMAKLKEYSDSGKEPDFWDWQYMSRDGSTSAPNIIVSEDKYDPQDDNCYHVVAIVGFHTKWMDDGGVYTIPIVRISNE